MNDSLSSLVLTRFRPDRPNGGAALRNWQNIRALAHLGPVDVISVGVRQPKELIAGVRDWIPFAPSSPARKSGPAALWHRLQALRMGRHPAVEAYRHPGVAAWLKRHVTKNGYDVVVLEEVWMAVYLPELAGTGCRIVFDAHNVETALRSDLLHARSREVGSLRKRAAHRLLHLSITREERRAARQSDLIWACSERDARLLAHSYQANTPVTVVPNTVDLQSYRRDGAIDASASWDAFPLTIAFPGAFSYFPNEDAAMRLIGEVLPALRSRGCDPRLLLVGRDPTAPMLAAAARDPRITVTGAVESVLPYLEQPCIVALPIHVGSGTRLKVLESFAVGRPVVSTAKGAEGIGASDGEHLLLRERADEMAKSVYQLWHDRPLRARLCANAFDLVDRRYSWTVATRRIAESLGAVVREPVSVA